MNAHCDLDQVSSHIGQFSRETVRHRVPVKQGLTAQLQQLWMPAGHAEARRQPSRRARCTHQISPRSACSRFSGAMRVGSGWERAARHHLAGSTVRQPAWRPDRWRGSRPAGTAAQARHRFRPWSAAAPCGRIRMPARSPSRRLASTRAASGGDTSASSPGIPAASAALARSSDIRGHVPPSLGAARHPRRSNGALQLRRPAYRRLCHVSRGRLSVARRVAARALVDGIGSVVSSVRGPVGTARPSAIHPPGRWESAHRLAGQHLALTSLTRTA